MSSFSKYDPVIQDYMDKVVKLEDNANPCIMIIGTTDSVDDLNKSKQIVKVEDVLYRRVVSDLPSQLLEIISLLGKFRDLDTDLQSKVELTKKAFYVWCKQNLNDVFSKFVTVDAICVMARASLTVMKVPTSRKEGTSLLNDDPQDDDILNIIKQMEKQQYTKQDSLMIIWSSKDVSCEYRIYELKKNSKTISEEGNIVDDYLVNPDEETSSHLNSRNSTLENTHSNGDLLLDLGKDLYNNVQNTNVDDINDLRDSLKD